MFNKKISSLSLQDKAERIQGREARLKNWESRWDKKLASKFSGDPIPGPGMEIAEYYSFSESLSMQDINRYQFRRSHSSEDGFKVMRAGSEKP